MSEVAEEMPDFKLCLHSFFVEEDIIPSVMRFLNHDVDEKCAKTVLETKELSMSEYVSVLLCIHETVTVYELMLLL